MPNSDQAATSLWGAQQSWVPGVLNMAFCWGLPGDAGPHLIPLTPRNIFVVLGINFVPFRASKNYSLQAVYSRNVL